MKKLITAALLSVVTLTASANTVNLPARCVATKSVEDLVKKYREEAVFVGLDDTQNLEGITFLVFFNRTTGSYTVVLTNASGETSCVIAMGTKGRVVHNN